MFQSRKEQAMSTQTAIGQQHPTQPHAPAAPGRLAGAAGLIFAASLVADNLIRAFGPGQGASPAQVTDYFLHHRVAALVPLGLFAAAVPSFFPFIAAFWARAKTHQTRWWAGTGALGAAFIAAMFGVLTITEIVLTAKAGYLAASPAVVQALWAMHGAAFGLDLAAIAVTLIGLSRAAAEMRLIPSWLALATWPGAACLLVASVFTVALVNGGPWIAVGLVGFVVWLLFVIIASISLLRSPQIPETA
jgi:hypothetical protein